MKMITTQDGKIAVLPFHISSVAQMKLRMQARTFILISNRNQIIYQSFV